MIGSKVLNQQKYVINIITTEDGERYVNLNDIIQLFPTLSEVKSNNISEKNLHIGLDYISQYLKDYEYLKLYSTTKHHGVKFSRPNVISKDTLFYILEENQSYLTLAIKKFLLESNIIKFQNYLRVDNKSQEEIEQILSLDQGGEESPYSYYNINTEIFPNKNSDSFSNKYFINPYYRTDFFENLKVFIKQTIGEDGFQNWNKSLRLFSVENKKTIEQMFIDGDTQIFSPKTPLLLPELNNDCSKEIIEMRMELERKFNNEVKKLYYSGENSDYISWHLSEEENIKHFYILSKFESFPSYEMFFVEQVEKGYILKVHEQKRYRDTFTLRPTTEEYFKHIIDYLFEEAVDKYLDSYNTK